MGLLSKNVIPGNHGKTFGTNALKDADLLEIKTSVREIDEIIDVIFNTTIFPREFTVHTNKIVAVQDIENKVKKVGFHAISKESFML